MKAYVKVNGKVKTNILKVPKAVLKAFKFEQKGMSNVEVVYIHEDGDTGIIA